MHVNESGQINKYNRFNILKYFRTKYAVHGLIFFHNFLHDMPKIVDWDVETLLKLKHSFILFLMNVSSRGSSETVQMYSLSDCQRNKYICTKSQIC